MTKHPEEKVLPEALATFVAAGRNKDGKPPSEATPETSAKPGDLAAEQKDAADILAGNATGDTERADAARKHHAKTDKRAE